MKTIITQETIVNDIPVTFVYQQNTKIQLKAIFFYHGLSNHYFEGLELAHTLAHLGYFVVMPDAQCHGRRKSLSFFTQSRLKTLGGMYQIIGETKNEFLQIYEYLKNNYDINLENVGVCGYSMGGITSFYLASQLDMISVCIPFIGLPSFVHEWDNILKSSDNSEYGLQIRDYLLSIDPFYRLEKYAPNPLLIINGIQDKSILIEYSEIFYDHIKGFYQSYPDHLKFSKYDVDHRVVKEMIYEASEFFQRFL